MPSFWKIKFNHWLNSPWGSVLFCHEGKPYPEISSQYNSRSQSTSCMCRFWEPTSVGTLQSTDGRWWNSAFTHLESPVTTCIPSYSPNFCEVTIPCLLKSRHRCELNDCYLTNLLKLCASYQAICLNRKNCQIFFSLVTCK